MDRFSQLLSSIAIATVLLLECCNSAQAFTLYERDESGDITISHLTPADARDKAPDYEKLVSDAMASSSKKNYPTAIKLFESALAQPQAIAGPSRSYIIFCLGSCYEKSGNYQKASTYFSKLSKNDSEAQYELADCFFKMNNLYDAERVVDAMQAKFKRVPDFERLRKQIMEFKSRAKRGER